MPAREVNRTIYEAVARGSTAAGQGYRCRSLTPSAGTRRRPLAGSGTAVSQRHRAAQAGKASRLPLRPAAACPTGLSLSLPPLPAP